MKKNRIVIFGWADSVHVQRWCKGLSGRGFQIKLISVGGEPLDYVETVILPRGGKLSYITNIPKARREAKSFKPDLVHAHYIAGHGLLAWRSGIKPFIGSVWGADVMDLPHSLIYKLLIRRILKAATHITATSEILAKVSMSLHDSVKNKITVIPFGVAIPNSITELPPSPPVRICFVKSLKPKYGVTVLIQAMSLVVKKFPGIVLTIAGAGPLERDIRSQIKELRLEKNVSLIGFVENIKVYDIIREHHFMVMPSVMESESFGVAAIEAGACGRSVIASRVGGVPEVVIDGHNGLLVSPGNVEELAQAIEKLADNISLSRTMGQMGYELVKEKYDWEKSLDRMSELYQRLIYESQKS